VVGFVSPAPPTDSRYLGGWEVRAWLDFIFTVSLSTCLSEQEKWGLMPLWVS
jgi:hypothetical protein